MDPRGGGPTSIPGEVRIQIRPDHNNHVEVEEKVVAHTTKYLVIY